MENNYYFNLLTYFIIYSFLGWIMESVFRSICEKKLINTGFLYGPFCPIYGLGSIIMILFLGYFSESIILLFIISFISLTLWEYLVGVILEVLFKTKYWDYSKQKFNFQGRICLTNSICWGILGVVFIKFIHPFMVEFLKNIDSYSLHIAVYLSFAIFLVDTIISIIKLVNIKATLEKIEKINEQIKEKVVESKNIENVQLIVDKLKLKRDRTIRRLYRHVYRLKKAFPAISTKEITEVLSKKIEIHRKGKKGE